MPGKFLFDTNIIIYLLKENDMPFSEELQKVSFSISIITELELLSGSKLTKADENLIKKLMKEIEIINITDDIKEKTIITRKKYNFKLPDAIICATAISHNIPMVSNDKVFDKVEEAKILAFDEFLNQNKKTG